LGKLEAGFPKITWFSFSAEHLSLLPVLFGSVIAISIIGMLESASITKSLAAKSGQQIEPNQELMGMGAGNIACAIFGAVPGSSSFTRSSVNYQCGAATQVASMFSSVVVLFVLLFVTPIFNYIPVAALAAHLIRVGFKMVVLPQIRVACRSTRSDAVVFAGTLFASLFLGLDIAIYVGIGISLALFLQKTSSPILVEYAFDDTGALAELTDKSKRPNPQIAIIHVEGELFFGAADVFLNQVRKQADDENIKVFILRMKNARHLDASTVMALDALHEYLEKKGRFLLISGCTEDVMHVLQNSGVISVLGESNIFPGDASNPNVSTRKALMRASQLLAGEADIRIFYDKRHENAGKVDKKDYVLDFEI
jgi:SulP family sulfate permease